MSYVPLNPRPMVQGLVGTEVVVRLKWGATEYTGRLVSVDGYLNMQLGGAEEWVDGRSRGVLGQILIRCNNVLWISARKGGKDANGDSQMQG